MTLDRYNVDDSENREDFEFDFEKQEMISATGEGQDIEKQLLSVTQMDRSASDTGLYARMPAPLPLRPTRTFHKSHDRSSPSISGRELLNLEGRPSPEAQIVATSMPEPPPVVPTLAPLLRKKAKFSKLLAIQNLPLETQPSRFSTIPKLEKDDGCQSSHQPTDSSLSPASYELTQRFQQQINLHTNRPELSPLSMQKFPEVQREPSRQPNGQMSPPEVFEQHRRTFSEQTNSASAYTSMVDYHQHNISRGIPRDVDAPMSTYTTQTPGGYDLSQQQQQQQQSQLATSFHDPYLRQHRPTHSWSPAPPGFPGDLTVTPGQIHSQDWGNAIPDTSPTYLPGIPLYPPSSCEEGPPVYAHDGLNRTFCEPMVPFSSEVGFPHHPMHNSLLDGCSSRRARTPPPSSEPSALSPPEVPLSPVKTARTARPRNTASIRHRKTTTTLKSSRSQSSIKPSKSAGHLRSKKSIGQGLNSDTNNHHHRPYQHQHQGVKPIKKQSQQEMNFGFMNYTPEDSKKILTGVAPSGSSKTKARRELEASEARKRMSMAAFKAIEVAGGDTEALKQQFKVEVDATEAALPIQ